MKKRRFNKNLSTLTLASILCLSNTISADAIEVDPQGTHNHSIAIISSQEGKENRTNYDYRIPSVMVELWKDGSKISEERSDDWGVAFFDNVPPGDYELRFSDKHRGLRLSSEQTVEVSIAKNESEVVYNTYTGNFRNTARTASAPKGELEITFETTEGDKMPHVEVVLQGVSNKDLRMTLVANDKGVASMGNLEPGEYVLRQTEESAKTFGYKPNLNTYKVTVNGNKTSNVTIKNEKEKASEDDDFINVEDVPSVKESEQKKEKEIEQNVSNPNYQDVVIQVLDPQKDKDVEGVTVNVYKKGDRDNILHSVKTDNLGAINLKNLDEGSYEYVIEGEDKFKIFEIEDYKSLFEQSKEEEDKNKKSDNFKIENFISSQMSIWSVLIISVTLVSIYVLIKRRHIRRKEGDEKNE